MCCGFTQTPQRIFTEKACLLFFFNCLLIKGNTKHSWLFAKVSMHLHRAEGKNEQQEVFRVSDRVGKSSWVSGEPAHER